MLRRVEGILRRLEAETRAQNAAAAAASRMARRDDGEPAAAEGRAGPVGAATTLRSAGKVWGGTFHATATRLLRLHGRSIGLDPSFTILDRGDAEDLMGVLRTDLGLAKSDRRFPLKGTCMDIYSRCVNARETVEEAVEVHFPWCKDEVDDLRKLFAAYVDRKGEQSVLDYDDLLLFWHGLLTDARAARSIRGRFDCVLVDEYQDTNVLQAEILADALSRRARASRWSATTPSRSTPSAPPPSATSSTSPSSSPAPRSSPSSRTTAAPSPSSTPPTT